MTSDYSKTCTPTFDCEIEDPVYDLVLKSDIFANYQHPFTPEVPFYEDDVNLDGLAENAHLHGLRYGLIGNSANERNCVTVTPTNPLLPVLFDFPAVLAADYVLDSTTNQIPYSTIDGYPAHLKFFGGLADDYAVGGTFEDEFYGNDGNDTFYGGGSSDKLAGEDGDDSLYGESGDDLLLGGEGYDFLDGGLGDDWMEAGRGDDRVVDMDGDNVVYGNAVGNPGVGSDDDWITTGAGNDTIYGQDGADLIEAGDGNNQVSGGSGNDWITTGIGEDTIVGDSGDDVIYSGSGDDDVCGGSGRDYVEAGSGHDRVAGDGGADKLKGQGGNDLILGGGGNDKLYGNAGNDVLAGNGGNDKAKGGKGDDVIWFGAGRDVGVGGAGDDVFAFDDNGGSLENLGRNKIKDFTQDFDNADVIDFKCVEDLTHMSVIALGDDKVRLLGYADDWNNTDPDFDQLLFDVFVHGDNIGTINSAAGSLMQDSAYSSGYGLVCMNEGVLVDIGNTDDWDLAHKVTGDDFLG